MSHIQCPFCGEFNGVVGTYIFQCRCARERQGKGISGVGIPVELEGGKAVLPDSGSGDISGNSNHYFQQVRMDTLRIDPNVQLIAAEARRNEAKWVRSPEEAKARCAQLDQEIANLRASGARIPEEPSAHEVGDEGRSRQMSEPKKTLVEGLKVEKRRWVIVAEGEGAAARVLDADADLHAAVHEFMCVCGKPWEQCDSLAPEELRFIDDLDEWAFDKDGERFSCSMRHETGSITLYQLECAAQHLKREQEPAPGELRKTIIEELYKRHNGLSPQWIDDFAAFVVRVVAQPPQELVSLREALQSVIDERDTELDMMHCPYTNGTREHDAWHQGVREAWERFDVVKRKARAALTRGAVGGT